MRRFPIVLSASIFTLAGCAAEPSELAETSDEAFSSREAVQLDFELDGELLADSSWNPNQTIQDQFLYTIGHLNADRSVGRLDRLVLTNVRTESAGAKTRITYHAKMPVSWGRRSQVPTSYTFTLPRDTSWEGQTAFTTKYKDVCVDASAHDVDAGSMWYHYRPKASRCALDPADVFSFTATVTPSTENTTGKYPEYHQVWKDDELRVIAIFGKNEENATANDAGISAYDSFVASMHAILGPLSLTTEPANVPSPPGNGNPDITLKAVLADGKKITVNALLVDKISSAPQSFYQRYEQLTASADVIIYNGHAGLGQNVRALANRGTWVPGKYLMLFMNGCDTFAYVDGSLAQKRAPLNPDDPTGTKYMDIVTNGMPSYFSSNSRASTALVKGLMSIAAPKTYEEMFSSVDTSQVVLVTGEEDNVFAPGMPIGSGASGEGGGDGALYAREESGMVTKGQEVNYDTPELPAGKYEVVLSGSAGDADLYVKAGEPPTKTSYDCRPYKNNSNEKCILTLTAPAKIYANVLGYAPGENAFKLTVKQLPPTPPSTWDGMSERGTIAKNAEQRYQTPELPAGSYTFTLAGTGDADLYVRVGAAPSTSTYGCRSISMSSNETCTVSLETPSSVHVMVHGWAPTSDFKLTGN